jgi:hypothetical protein
LGIVRRTGSEPKPRGFGVTTYILGFGWASRAPSAELAVAVVVISADDASAIATKTFISNLLIGSRSLRLAESRK